MGWGEKDGEPTLVKVTYINKLILKIYLILETRSRCHFKMATLKKNSVVPIARR